MQFPITFWYGLPEKLMFNNSDSGDIFVNLSRLEEMKEAGFTHINGVNGNYSVKENKLLLDACEKLGLKFMVYDSRVDKARKNPEQADSLIKSVTNEYSGYSALYAYYVTDEPNSADFDSLSMITSLFKKYDPQREAYINLFPNYANSAQLGNPTYYEHIEQYLNTVKPKALSYDHYHFLNENNVESRVDFTNEREALIYYAAQKKTARGGFFDNLETVRTLSLKYNTPFMLIVLLVEHGPYRYLSEAEIRFEVFQSLAYGCCGMSYFTYFTPDYEPVWRYRNAMIDVSGTRTQHYYDVKKINAELSSVAKAIDGRKSVGVFHVGEEKENVTAFSGIYGVESITGGRVTAGFFEGGLLLLSNKDFENEAGITVVSTSALSVFDPITESWSISDGKIKLAAGNGTLIKLN